MAETADETSTPWRLWRAELAFVAEYTQSEKTAKDLLVSHLDAGRLRWRYWQMAIDDREANDQENPTSHKPRVFLCPTVAVKRFIWQTYRDGKYVTIDDANSAVTYIGPPWALGGHDWAADKPLDWEKVTLHFFPQLPPVTVCLSLICLHHDDVLVILRGVGLLAPASASPSSSPPQPQALPQPKPTTTITAKEAARLDPTDWAVLIPDRFAEKPEEETRAEYFDRVWKQMRKELGGRAWSRDYFERRCYELKVVNLRQPRAKP